MINQPYKTRGLFTGFALLSVSVSAHAAPGAPVINSITPDSLIQNKGQQTIKRAGGRGATAPKWLYYLRAESDSICRVNTATLMSQPVKFALDPPGYSSTSWAMAVHGCKIYWTTEREILRCNMDGTGVEVVLNAFGDGNVQSFALDATAAKVYWSTWFPQNGGVIRRANLDGSAVETLVNVGANVYALALDSAGGKMYWNAPGDFWAPGLGIQRANLDGSNVEVLTTVPAANTTDRRGLALDLAAQKVYWTEYSAPVTRGDTRIRRANLDGSNVEDFLIGLRWASDLIVDSEEGKLYWRDSPNSTGAALRRANTDRTEIETVASYSHVLGLAFTSGTVDADCGQPPDPCPPNATCSVEAIYKVSGNSSGGNLWRANGDGSDLRTIVNTLTQPLSVAVDKSLGKVYWTTTPTCNCATAVHVFRSNLDGSGVQPLVVLPATSGAFVNDIELDVKGEKMYFARRRFPTASQGTIYRANLDGTDVQTVLTVSSSPSQAELRCLDLDLQHGKIYFGLNKTVYSANLNGTGTPAAVVLANTQVRKLDLTDGKIYWTEYPDNGVGDRSPSRVVRANLDGSNVETVIAKEGFDTITGALELHAPSGRLYWGCGNQNQGFARFMARASIDDQSDFFCIAYSDGANIPDLALLADESVPMVPGDINGDGAVNIDDLVLVITHWGPCPLLPPPSPNPPGPGPGLGVGSGDMNCDNVVNSFDINPFMLALNDFRQYFKDYPDCDLFNGDMNDSDFPIDQADLAIFCPLAGGVVIGGQCLIAGPCPWDVNQDGIVNIDDLVFVITHWG